MIEYQAQCTIHKNEKIFVCTAEKCSQKRLICQACRKKDYVHSLDHGKYIHPWQEFIHFLKKNKAVDDLTRMFSSCKTHAETHKSHYEKQINMLRKDFAYFKDQVMQVIAQQEEEMLKLLFSEANKFDSQIRQIQSHLQSLANKQNLDKQILGKNNTMNEKKIDQIIKKNSKIFQLKADLMTLRENFIQSKSTEFLYPETDGEGFLTRQGRKFIESSLVPFLNHFEDDGGSILQDKRSVSTEEKTPTLSQIQVQPYTKYQLPKIMPEVKKVLKHLPEIEEMEELQDKITQQIFIPAQGFFSGEVKEGIIEGWGKFIFNDGSIYQGQWKDDSMNGYGRIIFKEAYYEGKIANGKAEGQGKYENNELIYDGEWKNDKKHGFGKEEYKRKKWIYIGEFVQNSYEGRGELINKDYIYQGNFENGQFHGRGIIYYKTKEVFEGMFENGQMKEGKLTYPDETQYEGEFENNLPHGEGSFTWVNGIIYQGSWKNGKQDGVGTQIMEDKEEYHGVWRQGQWINWI